MWIWKQKNPSQQGDNATSADHLEQFQVEVDPPPPLIERLRKRLKSSQFRPLPAFLKHWGWAIGVGIVLEATFVLLNYYECYQSVFPGSKVAAVINRTGSSGTAFEVFKWIICSIGLALTGPVAVILLSFGVRLVKNICPRWVVVPFSIIWIPICVFLGTWQFWISFMLLPVWTNHIYNGACQGWDMSADLHGVSWNSQSQSLPYVGVATIFLANGNYSMQLRRDDINHDVFTFYSLQTFDYTPPFSNITYDFLNATYTIDNVTTHFTLEPNLQFPSLDLTLFDKSIPFESTYGPPNADLVYQNGSDQINVFNTVTTKANDCTQLKACGMLNPKGSFEIAMGVVMIQQYYYSVSCTTPSGN